MGKQQNGRCRRRGDSRTIVGPAEIVAWTGGIREKQTQWDRKTPQLILNKLDEGLPQVLSFPGISVVCYEG